MVGNKTDRITERAVTYETAKAMADQKNIDYIETSAQTGDNVMEAFKLLATKLVKQSELGDRLGDSADGDSSKNPDEDCADGDDDDDDS